MNFLYIPARILEDQVATINDAVDQHRMNIKVDVNQQYRLRIHDFWRHLAVVITDQRIQGLYRIGTFLIA